MGTSLSCHPPSLSNSGNINQHKANPNFSSYHRCVICDEYSERNQGFFCENRHFVCTLGGCFDNYARSAVEPDAAGRSYDNDGNLLCPSCNPPVKYALPPGIESLIQLKVNVLTARAQADHEKNLRAEFTRIQGIEVLYPPYDYLLLLYCYLST